MGFKCEKCKKVQPAGTQPHRVVIETRERPDERGTEIVKEMNLCDLCIGRSPTIGFEGEKADHDSA